MVKKWVSMRKEAKDWLKQAKADMKTAKDCLAAGNYYATAFFGQQAVEKLLKSYFIAKKKKVPPKTHNLLELSLELKIPNRFLTTARELTPAFIIARYPDAAGRPPVELYDNKTATEILKKAERFFGWLKNRMKG